MTLELCAKELYKEWGAKANAYIPFEHLSILDREGWIAVAKMAWNCPKCGRAMKCSSRGCL